MKEEQRLIESRSQEVIDILRQVTYKQKPTNHDMDELRRAITILEPRRKKPMNTNPSTENIL